MKRLSYLKSFDTVTSVIFFINYNLIKIRLAK